MKIGRMIWMLLGVLCLCMGVFGQETDAPAELPVVVVCPIEGMVDDGMKVVVDRAIREAKNAELLIFKVDTPGGRVDSAIEISKSIVSAPCKTVAYIVGEGAISAGALISYSCDEIIMAPVTNIGATAPVNMTGEDIPETMDMKAKSFLRARFRALGEEKGHNTLLAEAMVESDIAIWAVPLAGGGYEIVEEAASRNTKRGGCPGQYQGGCGGCAGLGGGPGNGAGVDGGGFFTRTGGGGVGPERTGGRGERRGKRRWYWKMGVS